MYNGFYIKEKIGNNFFAFEKRKNKKIWVAALKKIKNFNEIKIGKKIAFEDYDFDGKLSTNYGLENFYEIERPHPLVEEKKQKIYIFDNHNHALYFWLKERNDGFIADGNILFHIDEHADYRDPKKYLLKPLSLDNKKVFEYVNFSEINVGNYIIPAEKEGIIKKTIQLRSSLALEEFLQNSLSFGKFSLVQGEKILVGKSPLAKGEKILVGKSPLAKGEKILVGKSPLAPLFKGGNEEENIILNLDLDFFCPNLDFIDFELKKKVIKKIFNMASLITISTSPFFIDQELALEKLKDLELL